jgi:hypothetical protein
MNRYLFEYKYKGETYALEIPAESRIEALTKIGAIRTNGAEYRGEIAATIPASGGWLVRAFCVVANFFRSK